MKRKMNNVMFWVSILLFLFTITSVYSLIMFVLHVSFVGFVSLAIAVVLTIITHHNVGGYERAFRIITR